MNCWIILLLLLCCGGNENARCRRENRMTAPEPPERMAPPRPPRPPYEDCGCD